MPAGLNSIPHSSHSIALRARHSPGRFARRALDAASLPLLDYFNRTDLQWYGEINVGTPPQPLTVVFDTGSMSLEFTSTQCTHCNLQTLFDSSASTSFIDTKTTDEIVFATGVGLDPVVGEDTKLTLRSGIDTVSLGGLSAPSTSLWLITDQTSAFFDNPFDGIMGMGSQLTKGLFFSRLVEEGLEPVFGMLLTADDEDVDAKLTLGGADTTQFTGGQQPVFAPLTGRSGSHWVIESSGIAVGQNAIDGTQALEVIFDSGTSTFAFDPKLSQAIYAQISPEIKPNTAQPGTWIFPCSILPFNTSISLGFTFPSESGQPFTLSVPASALSVGPFPINQNETCQGAITDLAGYTIVGGSVLKEYYSVWDVGKRRLGFVAREGRTPLVGSISADTSTTTGGNGSGAKDTGFPRQSVGMWKTSIALIVLGLLVVA